MKMRANLIPPTVFALALLLTAATCDPCLRSNSATPVCSDKFEVQLMRAVQFTSEPAISDCGRLSLRMTTPLFKGNSVWCVAPVCAEKVSIELYYAASRAALEGILQKFDTKPSTLKELPKEVGRMVQLKALGGSRVIRDSSHYISATMSGQTPTIAASAVIPPFIGDFLNGVSNETHFLRGDSVFYIWAKRIDLDNSPSDVIRFDYRIQGGVYLGNGALHNIIIDSLLTKVTSGDYGFKLQELGECAIASYNPDFPYYPASTIKVLQLVHALLAVDRGDVTLAQPVTTYPVVAESCADTHAGHHSYTMPLRTMLRSMMDTSNNQSTNAIQELFGGGDAARGRQAINNTGYRVLGMSRQSAIRHKFKCGGPASANRNTLTANDITKLYERFTGGLIDSVTMLEVPDIMDEVGIRSAVDAEGLAIGMSNADRNAFFRQIKSFRKNGSFYDSGLRKHYFSAAGWISFPSRSGPAMQFTYNIFVSDVTLNGSHDDFGYGGALNELLRPAVRQALLAY